MPASNGLLAQFLKEQGRRTPVAGTTFKPTAQQELAFERIIKRLIEEWAAAINSIVIPEYSQVSSISQEAQQIGVAFGGGMPAINRLNRALEAAAQRTAQYAETLMPDLVQVSQQFAEWHRLKFIQSIKKATKVDLSAFTSPADTQALLDEHVRRNVNLIKGLDFDMRRKVEQSVLSAWNKQYPVKDLRKQLGQDLGFAPNRAKVIAQDQVNKFTAQLDRMRQDQMGIKKYIWVETFIAKKPRPEHVARNGKVFSWDNPPEDGHPGEAILCHCRPKPYIEPDQ